MAAWFPKPQLCFALVKTSLSHYTFVVLLTACASHLLHGNSRRFRTFPYIGDRFQSRVLHDHSFRYYRRVTRFGLDLDQLCCCTLALLSETRVLPLAAFMFVRNQTYKVPLTAYT